MPHFLSWGWPRKVCWRSHRVKKQCWGRSQRFFFTWHLSGEPNLLPFFKPTKFFFFIFYLGFDLQAVPLVFFSRPLRRVLFGQTTFSRQPEEKNVGCSPTPTRVTKKSVQVLFSWPFLFKKKLIAEHRPWMAFPFSSILHSAKNLKQKRKKSNSPHFRMQNMWNL